ncbi:MAG TPA: 6-phospho-3-hexuloisomerase [Rhodobacteraceae bacterium]|jgi:6-phospho-3-hexuloisomerase|nr:SIS domain-containing protein [Paracoccaceae bacterium]HBG98467.1 6-phospho-3-hexuloisomerase [Paracoccaceae bacterium]
MTPDAMARQALEEVGAVLTSAMPGAADAMAGPILSANRIALYGVGREGLMMKALAMRLYHMGLDAHVVGDMTTPPLGPGDLLIVSAGPGHFSTVGALMGVARDAGAQTLCVTAQPDGACPQAADHVVHLPAQTMADDTDGSASILPMGSLYEAAQLLFFEILVLNLRARKGVTPEAMRGFHTNLE